MKLYDPSLQTGSNLFCSKHRGFCSHLCLPISSEDRICQCAIGFTIDPSDNTKCIGIDEFLLFAVESEIKGVSLTINDTRPVLGPLSKTSMATSIDFYEGIKIISFIFYQIIDICISFNNLIILDYIYWSDDEQGTIMRIKRDGTGRKIIVDHENFGELRQGTWVSGKVYLLLL